MSTPKSDRQRHRQTRYLEAARKLFVAHGYARTTIDMIVAEVGGSKATFYNYFPDKPSLVSGLIASVLERARDSQGGGSFDGVPLRDALTRFGRVTLDVVVGDAAVQMLRLAAGEVNRFPDLARALWDSGPANAYAAFSEFILKRRALGELDFEDSQLACEHFLGTIAGHIQLRVVMGISVPPDSAERSGRVEAAVELFLARYGTKANSSSRS